MGKGRFGIRLCMYPVLAFIMAYFGNITVLFLIAGAVFFLERDEWTGHQIIQALCLGLVKNIFSAVLGLFVFFNRIPVIGQWWGVTDSILDALMSLLVLVFCIVGILNNLKGKDAGIIGANKLADWAYGIGDNA